MYAERTLRHLLLVTLLSLLAPLAHAKGPFQAGGTVTEVRRQGDTLLFGFTGRIDFGFSSASVRETATEWKDVRFEVTKLQIEVKDWTEPYNPGQRAASDNVARVHQKLLEVVRDGGKTRLSIDNPSLTFSNFGELVKVTGTFVYTAAVP